MQGKQFRKREAGQGLVEYALIMVLVAIVVIVILATMGPAISDAYCGIVLELNPGGECTAAVAANEENNEQLQPILPKPTAMEPEENEEQFLRYYCEGSESYFMLTAVGTHAIAGATCEQGKSFDFPVYTYGYPSGTVVNLHKETINGPILASIVIQ